MNVNIGSFFYHCGTIILVCMSAGLSKTRSVQSPSQNRSTGVSLSDVRTLEQRLHPYLTERSARRRHHRSKTETIFQPRESDFILLSKLWGRLSPEFRSLYKSAAQLPDSFLTYASPGGHFDILYTTSGADGVDPTDNYGYDPFDWRQKNSTANGIPDYIDETAFALDSTWSMEINRFTFVAPTSGYDERYPSDRYKVVIEKQRASYYGLTFLNEEIENNRGYSSTITLRNDWSGDEWNSLGYDTNPIAGVRVTCAHEFFHAIQYAMSWHVTDDIWLDDFPVGWTEGSAVVMEELAFDSINDYLQYSGAYFQQPTISFFSQDVSDFVYTNALPLLFIYYHTPSGKGIDFIRTMHFSNYAKQKVFSENLLETSRSIGSTWSNLLHSFHVESFFSGSRADPGRFIPDAAAFSMSEAPYSDLPLMLTRTMGSNSAYHVRLNPSRQHADTLTIRFNGEMKTAGIPSGNSWSVTALLQKKGQDSLVALPVDADGSASLIITPWRSLDEATFVITNADPESDRKKSFTITCNIDTLVPSDRVDLYPNPLSLRKNNSTSYVSGSDIDDIALYSMSGSLLWRLPEQSATTEPGRQRYTIPCRNREGTSFIPGMYTVIITRNEQSTLSPKRLRRTLLIAP